MFTQIYQVTGITCEACQYKVNHILSKIEGVINVVVDLSSGKTYLSTEKEISLEILQKAFEPHQKYKIQENFINIPTKDEILTEKKSWFLTYQPILLIFGYIFLVSILVSFSSGFFNLMLFMQVFMGGFFIVFSFFKMLNLKSFAESYMMYDVVAYRWKTWGFIYPFLELSIGIAFIVHFNPFITNLITLLVMSVSIIGVLESVFNHKKIRCACLGSVFNLPMSTITIIEDGLMILMSVIMLIQI
ncbi:MAG: heavy-metal-associated domain-containing protein [Bacteroidetes bacterium]|nr:MAG: heavy-metal-associated domain-containing protein [Bacteroidota bacterium]TAG85664.1 MAG: heavy-metal-associated domain-containing protein [Bacteroidota bacterium]